MTVAPRDLRNHYGDLLARAEQGERIDIVRNGRTIATMGPPRRPPGTPRGRLIEVFANSEPIDADSFFEDLYGRGGLDDGFMDPLGD